MASHFMAPRIGYHASHEQFTPADLLGLVQMAESAGFECLKCSDHFQPWSERQGQSASAWPWLGAAMQATTLPFGIISAPGYRYHPAILAQSIATIASLFEQRLWVALGSGEAINEAITGQAWPEKSERNARLLECIEVIRRLLDGETVTHRGRITVVEAKLYSRPRNRVPLYGAAVTEETARLLAPQVDGLLTTGGDPETAGKVVSAFREAGGAGKPVILQSALCWGRTYDEAMGEALEQWGPCAIGGEVNWDLRRPSDFDLVARSIGPREIQKAVFVSHELSAHAERIDALAELEPAEIHLHHVGRDQRGFIEVFGAKVLPQLR
jgi:probable non-F420 flavinoid oxidoreductase